MKSNWQGDSVIPNSIDKEQNDIGLSASRQSGQLVELLGLAGVGKSTIVKEICKSPGVAQGTDFNTENLTHHLSWSAMYLRHFSRVLPDIIRLGMDVTDLSREHVKKMIYLDGWQRIFRQQCQQNSIVLVDQGPIFCLATLYGFGPEGLRSKRFRSWWEHNFDSWAQEIDVVAWLECPQDILFERINAKQRHVVKNEDKSTTFEFLNKYQDAFSYIVSEMETRGKIEVIVCDTHLNSIPEVANRLSRHLGIGQCNEAK